MNRILLPFLLTICFASNLPAQDTLVLHNDTREDVFFYYVNPFRTLIDINIPPGKVHKLQLGSPVMLYSAVGTNRFTYYVKPGETLHVSNDAAGAVITADNTIRNNELKMFKDMMIRFDHFKTHKDVLDNDARIAQLKKDSIAYIRYLDDTYQEKLRYIDSFALRNNISDTFRQYAQQVLRYQMLNGKIEMLPRDQQAVAALPAFRDALVCDDCLNIRYYIDFVSNYTYRIYSAYGDKAYDTIASQVSGDTKDFMLMQIMMAYLQFSPKVFEQHYAAYMAGTKSPVFRSFISDFRQVKLLTRDFSNSELLLSPQGDTLRFDALLDQLKGRHVYIDFWASWCAPCIDALPGTMAFEDANRSVAVVYLSYDKDPMAWKQFMQRADLGKRRNYMVIGERNSALGKRFGVTTIPHYVLIGQDRKTVVADAPAAKEPALQALIKNLK